MKAAATHVPAALRRSRKSLGSHARASVVWAYGRSAVNGLVAVPTTIILARLLGPQDFGIAAAATFFGQLAARLANGGLGTALVRLEHLRPAHVATVFSINCVMGALGALALVAAAPAIGRFYQSPEVTRALPVVALNFVVGAMSTVPQALLTRDMRYRGLAVVGSIDVTVASVSSCVFAFFGLRYWSLVLGDVLGGTAKWIWAARLTGWQMSFRCERAALAEMWAFATGTYVKRILDHFGQNVDNLIVGKTLGLTALGFYDKAFSAVGKVFAKVTVVGPSIALRVFAIIQDEPERFRRAYRKVMMTAALGTFPLFTVLAAMAPALFALAFGAAWAPAVVPFQVLCAAAILKVVNTFASAAAQARGWIWSQNWRQVVYLVALAVATWGGSHWGISGAAAGGLVSTVAFTVLMQGMMRDATGLSHTDLLGPLFPPTACAIGAGAAAWGAGIATQVWAPGSNTTVLAAQATAATVVGWLLVRWGPWPEQRSLVREIVGDLSPAAADWIIPARAADPGT